MHIWNYKYMKSKELLDSFVKYCKDHPDERFWQALRNWCGWGFIVVSNVQPDQLAGHWNDCECGGRHPFQKLDIKDTFYWEENE